MIAVIASLVMPALLLFIGWRGIRPEQRTGTLRIIFAIAAVIFTGACVFVTVTVVMTPKWVDEACVAAWAENPPRADLDHATFDRGCHQLSKTAAECTRLSYATKFPQSCASSRDEIAKQIPAF